MECIYKKGEFIFSEDCKIADGEYYIEPRDVDCFFIYNSMQYRDLCEKIKKLRDLDVKNGSKIERQIFTRMEVAELKCHRLKLSDIHKEYIYSEKFTVIKDEKCIGIAAVEEPYESITKKMNIYKKIYNGETAGEY